ncbi:hypothetical protein [Ruegeria arenilitoris]|uniref:hypothetical protein n=1 Tax=Ruegeria arenilitoris TaxID=1173585 RepID=UPI00147C55C5|nr:hypothetical protein [Ruegeria arenilitoris]
MSDSVTNADVEDVLSSVKRLVSEEVREESEFIFIPTAARKPGRLVLTEALRVGEEEKSAPLKLVTESEGGEEAKKAGAETAGIAAPMRLHLSDIVRPHDETSEPDIQDEEFDDGPMPIVPLRLGERRDLAGSLSAKIEALEAAIARTEDQWEPDGESDDAYSGTPNQAVEWPQDPADQSAEEETETPLIFSHRADAPASVEEGSKALDEDVLSELVAQIVRQELQGKLGEGITRNIRKMVRREINKVIASQETS